MVLLLGWLVASPPAAAHPMGNFSINHFSALDVHPTLIQISYILDLAEIPTFQEIQDYGLNPQPAHPSAIAYRERKVQELQQGLWVQLGGQRLPLTVRTSTIDFRQGRVACRLYASLSCMKLH